jgi:hypothetical protein
MQPALKTSIVDYISQYHTTKTRYEIDKHLIDIGYDGADIDLAWQAVTQSHSVDKASIKQTRVRVLLLTIVMMLLLIPLAIAFPKITFTVARFNFSISPFFIVFYFKWTKPKNTISFFECSIMSYGICSMLFSGFYLLQSIFKF